MQTRRAKQRSIRLQKTKGEDYFKYLPMEIRDNILNYLDVKTLLACCCACKSWNEFVSSSTAWRRICCKQKIHLGFEGDEKSWKSMYLRVMRRKQRTFPWFNTSIFEQCVPINAFYYYEGKVATASNSKKSIKIWDFATEECLLTILYDSEITCVKFDDKYIMASFEEGEILSWNISTGKFICSYHRSFFSVSCFDYLLDANIVVAGFAKGYTCLWSMSTSIRLKILYDHTSDVIYVKLCSRKCSEITILLSAERDKVYVREMTTILRNESSDSIAVTFLSVSPPEVIPIQNPYRIVCVKEFLYYTEFVGNICVLCRHDLYKRTNVSQIKLKTREAKLLGVGRKYIAVIYREIKINEEGTYFSVLDRATGKIVTSVKVPKKVWDRNNCRTDFLCLNELSWMDRFDGRNDLGLVYVSISQNSGRVFAIEWTP